MALLEELLSASYKGAEFLISSSSTNGGRKDELHEFPNSDRQTIEDFGLLPRSYSIVGWITGENYIAKRNALLAALEDGEVGVLSHPFYGEIQNIKARSFSINETMTELGRAEISMLFDISNDIGSPLETENTLSKINKNNEVIISAVNSEIAENWNVNTRFSGNFSSAQDKLSEVESAFEDNSNVVSKITDNINAFNAQVSNFGNQINSLIQEPQALADSITNLAEGMNGLYATSDSQVIAWRGFFTFGESDVVTINKTAGLAERDSNNTTINQSMQSQALGYSYLAGAQVEYDTINELEDASALLEEQYQKVVIENSIGINLRDSITDMRESVNEYFNQQRVTLNRIISITTAELPARVISYQYYGNSNIGEEIANLNNDANVSFIEGQIQVVTQ